MIVKNEEQVVERCLLSVLPFIDAWVIVDTGSTDATMEIVRRTLSHLPGELVERPWVDFSTNRNQALDLARLRGNYALLIDADETLATVPGFRLPPLTADSYTSRHIGHGSDAVFQRVKLVRTALPWRYVGVLHEVIVCDEARTQGELEGLTCVGHFDGARNQGSQAEKYARDAAVLERGLQAEPGNARYVFYLAQSYRDAGDRARAIAEYSRRAAMGGWIEEVWYSHYQVGLLQLAEGNIAQGEQALLLAFNARPTRAEPLYELARHHRLGARWDLAYLFASSAAAIPRPNDRLFLTESVYTWRAADELSIAAYYVGRYEEALAKADELLRSEFLPADQRPRVDANRAFAAERLASVKGTISAN